MSGSKGRSPGRATAGGDRILRVLVGLLAEELSGPTDAAVVGRLAVLIWLQLLRRYPDSPPAVADAGIGGREASIAAGFVVEALDRLPEVARVAAPPMPYRARLIQLWSADAAGD